MTYEYPDQLTVSSGAQSLPKGVHLVGSIPLSGAEEVFRTTSSILGGRLRRIPDGETGIRGGWIGWQFPLFASNPNFEAVVPPPNAYVPRSRLKMNHWFLRAHSGSTLIVMVARRACQNERLRSGCLTGRCLPNRNSPFLPFPSIFLSRLKRWYSSPRSI